MSKHEELKPKVDNTVKLDHIMDCMRLAGSYARSAGEAAWREDVVELEIHIRQLRTCVIEGIKTFKEIGGA